MDGMSRHEAERMGELLRRNGCVMGDGDYKRPFDAQTIIAEGSAKAKEWRRDRKHAKAAKKAARKARRANRGK